MLWNPGFLIWAKKTLSCQERAFAQLRKCSPDCNLVPLAFIRGKKVTVYALLRFASALNSPRFCLL